MSVTCLLPCWGGTDSVPGPNASGWAPSVPAAPSVGKPDWSGGRQVGEGTRWGEEPAVCGGCGGTHPEIRQGGNLLLIHLEKNFYGNANKKQKNWPTTILSHKSNWSHNEIITPRTHFLLLQSPCPWFKSARVPCSFSFRHIHNSPFNFLLQTFPLTTFFFVSWLKGVSLVWRGCLACNTGTLWRYHSLMDIRNGDGFWGKTHFKDEGLRSRGKRRKRRIWQKEERDNKNASNKTPNTSKHTALAFD